MNRAHLAIISREIQSAYQLHPIYFGPSYEASLQRARDAMVIIPLTLGQATIGELDAYLLAPAGTAEKYRQRFNRLRATDPTHPHVLLVGSIAAKVRARIARERSLARSVYQPKTKVRPSEPIPWCRRRDVTAAEPTTATA